MSDREIVDATDLMVIRCCGCDVEFGITDAMFECRKSDGLSFYCPNGHAQRFGKSDAAKIAQLTEDRDFWKAEAERLRAERGSR